MSLEIFKKSSMYIHKLEIEDMSSLVDEAKRLSEKGRYEESSELIRRALARMKKNRDVEGLIYLATCGLPGVSYEIDEAIEALGERGDKRAVEPLLGMFEQELESFHWRLEQKRSGFSVTKLVDRNRTLAIVTALGLIGDRRSVKPLIELMVELLEIGPPPARARMNFQEFKEMMSSFQTFPIFGMDNANDMAEIRACIAWALGNIKDRRAVEPLIRVLHTDWAWTSRANAAIALGLIGDERSVDPLRIALKDDDENVREKAAEALKKFLPES